MKFRRNNARNVGFSADHVQRENGGRPLRRERDFQVQKRRKPLRCQPITVAGLTIAREPRQSGQKLEIRTQNQRSDGCSRDRGVFRFSTASCWRIAKLSKYEAANARSSRCRRATRSRTSIFRMAETLSGRWPVSQAYCGVRGFDESQVRTSADRAITAPRTRYTEPLSSRCPVGPPTAAGRTHRAPAASETRHCLC